jgi:SprT protein
MLDQCQQKLVELQNKAEAIFGVRFDIELKLNKRLTSTAGRAFYHQNLLELSQKLLQENFTEFLNDTIPHEFCHLLSYKLYAEAGKGHGQQWKATMLAMGYEPKRCHNYAVQKHAAKTAKFTCGCMVHEITPQRKAWMTRGKVYSCVKCGNVIKEVL